MPAGDKEREERQRQRELRRSHPSSTKCPSGLCRSVDSGRRRTVRMGTKETFSNKKFRMY
jgi:hypothetical protein